MSAPFLSLTDQASFNQGSLCSRLVLGVWRLGEWQMKTKDIRHLIHTCLEFGITTVDHADLYGDYTCESLFGEALREEPALREKLQLISKCGIKLISPNRPAHTIKHYDTSRAHILASVDNSLQQLQTDYLDVLLLHRPDPLMNADETAAAFTTLLEAGKVRHFGVSNFTPSQFDLLASRLSFPLVTNQVEISVMHLDAFLDGTLDQCQRLRIAPMAWSPLGGGDLFRSATPQAERLRSALATIGEQLGGATIDQVALAWLLSHPANIIPILGTGNLDRISAAVSATALTLTREQWFTIWSASTGTEVP
jgi:predicted oxidoreductase